MADFEVQPQSKANDPCWVLLLSSKRTEKKKRERGTDRESEGGREGGRGRGRERERDKAKNRTWKKEEKERKKDATKYRFGHIEEYCNAHSAHSSSRVKQCASGWEGIPLAPSI